jgi:hypothetical protein
MRLVGDTDGIAQLKLLHEEDKAYLKFLVGEAKSSSDLKAYFKAKDGRRFYLRLDLSTGDLDVQPAK